MRNISYLFQTQNRSCLKAALPHAPGGLGSSPELQGGDGISTTLMAAETIPAPDSARQRYVSVTCSAIQQYPSSCATYPGQMKAGCWAVGCQGHAGLWPLLCFPLMHCGQNDTTIRASNLPFERLTGGESQELGRLFPSHSQLSLIFI